MTPEVLRCVLESFVPLVRETVVAYYVLDTGDGTLATISVCEDEEKVETTNRVATVPGRPRGQKRGNIRTIAGVATKLMGEWRKGQSMSEQGLPETRAERTR